MNKLVATTLESKFNVYDLRTHHPTKGFTSLTEKVRLHLSYIYIYIYLPVHIYWYM